MEHPIRFQPEGRYQCIACRAAWRTEAAARRSTFICPGVPLAHGPTREHRIFPKSGDRTCRSWGCEEPDPSHYHGPDPFCDDTACRICCHACDCQVCEGTLHAPQLTVVEDIPEYELNQIPRRRTARLVAALQAMADDYSAGDRITAVGYNIHGLEVTRTGYLLTDPRLVRVRRHGAQVRGLRLCIGERGTDPAKRRTWVTLLSEAASMEHTPEPDSGK
ncbi:hypothetical protein [Streptomyces sp. NRRL F-5053]|uniref:hypothetical protein n=1 Tax=Streptomyces sp. NRRL F-5053 TaxID=1463854 RepID=UPI00133198D5|nr:hypothetical protein [Streptomyces sp. NRRL F-5053]